MGPSAKLEVGASQDLSKCSRNVGRGRCSAATSYVFWITGLAAPRCAEHAAEMRTSLKRHLASTTWSETALTEPTHVQAEPGEASAVMG